MSKVKIELSDAGIQELLKGSEMQSLLKTHGQAIAAKAGEGYASEVVVHQKRAAAYVYPETVKARMDNYENNTLLKAMG